MTDNKITKLTQNDIVISSRIRLARNLKSYPFPHKLNDKGAEQTARIISDAVIAAGEECGKSFIKFDMSKLSPQEAVSFMERHYISPEFVTVSKNSNKKGRVVLLSSDNTISVMVNEEDHIRIQVMGDGLSLRDAYTVADKLDTLISKRLDIAYDERFGFLTECPTNLGTGMRASVMLHLPALTRTRTIDRISANLNKLGFAIRGFNGEGSKSEGGIYQLSNQVSLGLTESGAVDNLYSVTNQLIEYERDAVKELVNDIYVKDSVFRSLGILKYSRLITREEAMSCLSDVRLGVAGGIVDCKVPSTDVFNRLLVDIQPATIVINHNCSAENEPEIEEIRSEILRKEFNDR